VGDAVAKDGETFASMGPQGAATHGNPGKANGQDDGVNFHGDFFYLLIISML
jgi:hypothetical protein